MIGRIHERRDFQRLNRDGRRARTETLWCRYLDDPTITPPRVAFAIGRAVGNAVVRNRVRRRLRALATTCARDEPSLLPHGDLLIGTQPTVAERSFEQLGVELTAMLCAVRRSTMTS